MRRTSPRFFGSVATGIGVLAAVSLALVAPSRAGAAQVPPSATTTTSTLKPTLIQTVCGKLPGLLQTVSDAGTQNDESLATARSTVDAKRLAMTVAMTDLAAAVVNHLGALDTAGNTPLTGVLLKSKQAVFVDSVVAWSKARTVASDLEQQLVFGELQKTMIDSIHGRACP
ncbi:MAG: hypothetical protein QOG82_2721 [Actinomycetota bacterium]|jgi:hypothetical protein|nr:hypothetical protein [Actinomycetota bacterium]